MVAPVLIIPYARKGQDSMRAGLPSGKVRRANIPVDLRSQFERYGEDVLAHAVAAGEHSSKGPDLDQLLREKRPEILEWLQEQKAASDLLETARFKTIRRWTIAAAIAGTIAAIAAVIAAWFTVWPNH
jgi:hypothetical protein